MIESKMPSVIQSSTELDIKHISEFEQEIREKGHNNIKTDHLFHAGMYARTITVPADNAIVGVLIKIPTLLIVSGDCMMLNGMRWVNVSGYNVIAAMSDRKQVFVAVKDTSITMIFPTLSKTVSEAEAEFTDEHESLISRLDGVENCIITTTAGD